MKLIILALIFTSVFAMADDQPKSIAGFDPKTDIIAENYEAGQYLIYDCKEKHWVCVTEEYHKECQEKRARDVANTEETIHSCAPIGIFPTKKSCFQRQLFLTTHDHGARFCIVDKWKSKAVSY